MKLGLGLFLKYYSETKERKEPSNNESGYKVI
jgi:hypothetical protein